MMKYTILSLVIGFSQAFVSPKSPSTRSVKLNYKNDIDAVERVLESASIYEDPIRSALGVAFLAQHGKVVVDEDCQLFPTGNLFGCVANPDPLGIAEDITDHHP